MMSLFLHFQHTLFNISVQVLQLIIFIILFRFVFLFIFILFYYDWYFIYRSVILNQVCNFLSLWLIFVIYIQLIDFLRLHHPKSKLTWNNKEKRISFRKIWSVFMMKIKVCCYFIVHSCVKYSIKFLFTDFFYRLIVRIISSLAFVQFV